MLDYIFMFKLTTYMMIVIPETCGAC